jgi:hypothetical protein
MLILYKSFSLPASAAYPTLRLAARPCPRRSPPQLRRPVPSLSPPPTKSPAHSINRAHTRNPGRPPSMRPVPAPATILPAAAGAAGAPPSRRRCHPRLDALAVRERPTSSSNIRCRVPPTLHQGGATIFSTTTTRVDLTRHGKLRNPSLPRVQTSINFVMPMPMPMPRAGNPTRIKAGLPRSSCRNANERPAGVRPPRKKG